MNFKNKVNVIEEGRKINLQDVLEQAGIHVNNKKAICPFHSDTRPSLSIWQEKNIFKCFVCGEKGDAISFWNKFYNFNDYFLASADLCFTFNIISIDDYNNIIEWRNKGVSSNKSYSKSKKNIDFNNIYEDTTNYEEILELTLNKHLELNIASDDILDKVYTVFIDTVKDFYGKTLSSKHMNDLINIRKLSIDEIVESKYFTFPCEHKDDFMDVFLDKLKHKNLTPLDLKNVPGFYFDKNLNQFSFLSKEGLCIPIKNLDNKIIRIQLRQYNSPLKYSWFSSSFAKLENENYKWGTSCGSISTAFIPSNIKSNSIIITEGHFKAKKISKEKQCITISVQGVSNWKSIIPLFDEIKAKYKIDNILIAFDCDFKFNDNVFNYAKLLGETLEKRNYFIYYLTWKYKFGKGIDDVINNGYIDKIKKVKKYEIQQKFILINNILKLELNENKINIKDKQSYFENLEEKSLDDLIFYSNYAKENHKNHPDICKIIKKIE